MCIYIHRFVLNRCLIILECCNDIQTEVSSRYQELVSTLDNRQKFEQFFPLKVTFVFFKLTSLIKKKKKTEKRKKEWRSNSIFLKMQVEKANIYYKAEIIFLSYELATLYWNRLVFLPCFNPVFMFMLVIKFNKPYLKT